MTGKEVIKKLEASGWKLKRIIASRHIMAKGHKSVPVPVHGNRDLKKGTLNASERETGVSLK